MTLAGQAEDTGSELGASGPGHGHTSFPTYCPGLAVPGGREPLWGQRELSCLFQGNWPFFGAARLARVPQISLCRQPLHIKEVVIWLSEKDERTKNSWGPWWVGKQEE